MKTYKLNMYGKTYEIALTKGSYSSNDTLAIEMVLVKRGKMVETWNMLTVNLGASDRFANGKRAFIDTNNNGEEIIKWLTKNNIAKATGLYGESGWCSYPLVQFTEEALSEMAEM